MLLGRTAHLQLEQREYFQQKADEEHWGKQPIPAHRGVIRDRNGHPLAASVVTYRVFIRPNSSLPFERVSQAAAALAPLIQQPPAQVAAVFRAPANAPVLVKDGLAYDLGVKIAQFGLPGVFLQKTTRRAYPEGNLAAEVIGFVGRDNQGLAGVEADFDAELAGRPGVLFFERDTRGEEIPLGIREEHPPEDGADLFLTLDRFIQRLVEQELEAALKRHQASGGTIIVGDPRTGEILAMASRPSFDLRKLDLSDPSTLGLYRNRAVADLYEPGSVFKTFTMAAAVEQRKVSPQSEFVCKGFVVKSGWTIHTATYVAHGRETVTDILANSCNVGTVWVSDLLGTELFYRYVAAFGFGQKTGIGLGGEAAGRIRTPADRDWWPLDLATNSFGQGVSVTPLQMLTATGAVANGGTLMRPQIVRQAVGPRGTRSFSPQPVRQVISPETARLVAGMLRAVSKQGRYTDVAGYETGTKTGTAQKPIPGGYAEKETIVSVAGFVPVDDPRVVMVVKLDEPQDNPWAGPVVGPVWKTIAEQLIVHFRIPPSEPARN